MSAETNVKLTETYSSSLEMALCSNVPSAHVSLELSALVLKL